MERKKNDSWHKIINLLSYTSIIIRVHIKLNYLIPFSKTFTTYQSNSLGENARPIFKMISTFVQKDPRDSYAWSFKKKWNSKRPLPKTILENESKSLIISFLTNWQTPRLKSNKIQDANLCTVSFMASTFNQEKPHHTEIKRNKQE